MIIPSTGIAAYSTTDQISRPPAEKLPVQPTEQRDAEGSGSPTDRAELSAEALALSRNIRSAGTASEQGETREEPAQSPPPKPRNSQQFPRPIDIRV